jgi:glycosyltransferase involved in cell wall biosynthesis
VRIAYFSPLPPQRSGIADYSLELLPYLAQITEVTLFTADPEAIDKRILNQYEVQSLEQYSSGQDRFDLNVYHIGNSEFHDDIARMAIEFPGVIVLHDFNLHHAVARRTLSKGDIFAYSREIGYEQGVSGFRRALALSRGFGKPNLKSPLNGRLLDISLGVIVHSRYTANMVRQQGYEGPVGIIPALISPITGNSRRADLKIPEDSILFGSFGLITKEKQIDTVLRVLSQLRSELPQAQYVLAGGAMSDVAVQETVRDLNLEDAVHCVGYVDDLSDFVDWIQTTDVVINLRNPTVGETSAVALRALAAGKALIVNDHGWYREIPSDAVLKVAPGSEDALLEAMRLSGRSKSLRKSLGRAGINYTYQFCLPEIIANRYVRELVRFQKSIEIYG